MVSGSCLLSLAGLGDGLGRTLCVVLWRVCVVYAMRGLVGDGCMSWTCTRLLGLDSMGLTCFLFGWVSYESTQSCSRAGESRLKLSQVARRGCSSGSKSILSQDSPKYLERDSYFKMGIVRNRICCTKENIWTKPRAEHMPPGLEYYLLQPQRPQGGEGIDQGGTALQPADSLTRDCQSRGG